MCEETKKTETIEQEKDVQEQENAEPKTQFGLSLEETVEEIGNFRT